MNRRELLTTAAASVMLPDAANIEGQRQASHPDAELIAACDRYLRIQRAWAAYCDAMFGDGDLPAYTPGEEMLDPLPGLVEQIVALPAKTAEGHLARARCAAYCWMPGAPVCQDDPNGAPEDRFNAAAMRDLVAMERGPKPSRKGVA